MVEKKKFGTIVLVDFPFSDGIRSKVRPALIISSHSDGDLLLARITSAPRESSFDVPLLDWEPSNLMFDSVVRVNKLTTILQSSVIRTIGGLSAADRRQVFFALRDFVASLETDE